MQFWQRFWEMAPYFLEVLVPAAGMTALITAGAFVSAVGGGLFLALLGMARIPVVRGLVRSYVEIVRGLPVLALLYILYIGLFEAGFPLGSIQAAILGLGLHGSAYLAEVFRAGIQSIHSGQFEAALTVGMTPLAAMRFVVLPQALNVVLPPATNYSITLLKDTAVVSAVAVPEIMFRARNLVTETYLSAQIYILVAAIYLVMSLLLSMVARVVERRLVINGTDGRSAAA